jgi:hypothetical protein
MVFYAYQLWKIIEIDFTPKDLFFQVRSVWLDFLLLPKQPMCPLNFISLTFMISYAILHKNMSIIQRLHSERKKNKLTMCLCVCVFVCLRK